MARKSNKETFETYSLDEQKKNPKGLGRTALKYGLLFGATGAVAAVAGGAVSMAHGNLPRNETSVTGGSGVVTDVIKYEAVCPVAYRTVVSDTSANVATYFNLDNVPIVGGISKILPGDRSNIQLKDRKVKVHQVAVNNEVCQSATDIERIHDQENNSLTYNIPIDALYVKSSLDLDAADSSDINKNGNTSELLFSHSSEGEGLELGFQLTKSIIDNTGIGRDSNIANNLNETDSTLLALALAEAGRISGEVCAPQVVRAAEPLYKESMKEHAKIGALDGVKIEVNLVDSDGNPALPSEIPLRDVFTAGLDNAKKASVDLKYNSNQENVSCELDKNIADNTEDINTQGVDVAGARE